MLKQIGFGIFALMAAVGLFSQGSRFGASSVAAGSPINVEAMLAEEAARANKSKGKTTGHSTFVEAVHRGKKLYYQYEVSLSVEQINTSVIADEFSKQSKAMACKGAFRRALDKGASLEYNYRTSRTKQFIFEARVNASTCKGVA